MAGLDLNEKIKNGIKEIDLLIPPEIVGKEYWTRGYFYNVDHVEQISIPDYGFYDIGKSRICDEYGNKMSHNPSLLGTYSVATDIGVARMVNQELILLNII